MGEPKAGRKCRPYAVLCDKKSECEEHAEGRPILDNGVRERCMVIVDRTVK